MIFKKKKTEDSASENTLYGQLTLAKYALDSAYSNFENVIEPDLIDSCIYELNAVQLRYTFLLNKVRNEQKKETHLVRH